MTVLLGRRPIYLSLKRRKGENDMDMEFMMLPLIWIALIIVFSVTEVVTQGITTIWFAIASAVSLLLAILGAPLWLQIGVFIVVALLLLIFIRDILVKKYNRGLAKTNVETIAGESAIVIEKINNVAGSGRVTIKGMEWAAAAEDDNAVFDEGAKVTVVEVKGVKVIVK